MFRITTKETLQTADEVAKRVEELQAKEVEFEIVKITKTQVDDQEPTFSEQVMSVEEIVVNDKFKEE